MSGMTPDDDGLREKVFNSPVGPDAPDAEATKSPGRDRSGNHGFFGFSGFQILMKADTQISGSGVSYVPTADSCSMKLSDDIRPGTDAQLDKINDFLRLVGKSLP